MLKLLPNALAIAAILLLVACTRGYTEISEAGFRLRLPGEWTGGFDPPSSTWVYLTATQEEGVTVAVLRRPAHARGVQLQRDFDAYLQARRDQEQKVSDEPMTLTQPQLRQTSGEITALYDGFGTVSKRRTRTLVIVDEVVAAAFYYEAFGLSEREFTDRAGQVLERASVTK